MPVLTHPTATRTRTDEELVAQVRAGHPDAFELVVRRHRPALESFARGLLSGAHHDAEEAVQDALLRALAVLRRDEREIILRPWLYAICRNACLDRLRARRPTVDLALVEPVLCDRTADLHAAVESREKLAEVAQRIRQLPARQRRALLAVAVDGRSHEEVARELAISVGASKTLVCRARRGLEPAAA